ncbi:hypothetical protein ACQE3E_13815 [Methylomonas sp. MED-D]|uniref:hypothetical protein n=1 Tax=unclassified Methylomonas TaxID=2608980 RepID=UPI0028A44168|nr:hypothetical protein [Methylomonas sp. MV1]MDT4331506.1 hypothetical protein [Methylomonas sp. MV1]
MNIHLHIERLVLDGVDLAGHSRGELQAGMTAELTRLLSEGGLATHLVGGGALPRLSTNAVQLTGNNPTQIGQQIAQSVYRGIGNE